MRALPPREPETSMSDEPTGPRISLGAREPVVAPAVPRRMPQGSAPPHLRVLGFVTLAMFFENYDLGMLGNVLPQLAEAFGLDKAELGQFTGATRLGALPAFFLLPLADRIGRRRLLLLSIAGMSLGSLVTTLAQTPLQFVLAQVATRTFIVSAAVTSFVVVAEEFPAAHRGWGIGMLGGVGAIGYGAGALVYGFVDWLPFGWRSLYALGVVPLLFLPALARGLRETARFTAARTEGSGAAPRGGTLRPIAELLRRHPRRALAIALIGCLSSAGTGTSFQFISEFLQTERGWTPGAFASLSVVFGAFAIVGNPVGDGSGSARASRRSPLRVLALFPLASSRLLRGAPRVGRPSVTLMVFLSMASTVCVRALGDGAVSDRVPGHRAGTLALLETVVVGVVCSPTPRRSTRLGVRRARSRSSRSPASAPRQRLPRSRDRRRELEDVTADG